MKKLSEKILFMLIARLLHSITATLRLTYKFNITGEDNRAITQQGSKTGGYLLACWHETVLTVSQAQRGLEFCALCSYSNIGQAVAYTMKKNGFHPISGSRSKGGKEARDEILNYLNKGVPTAITVDGSKGPRRHAKEGIVDLAKKGGVKILPVFSLPDKKWVLNSWDRFRIPKPFAKVEIAYGEPIDVPSDLAGEEYAKIQEQIKVTLGKLEAECTARQTV